MLKRDAGRARRALPGRETILTACALWKFCPMGVDELHIQYRKCRELVKGNLHCPGRTAQDFAPCKERAFSELSSGPTPRRKEVRERALSKAAES
jgi:hypothetical protein